MGFAHIRTKLHHNRTLPHQIRTQFLLNCDGVRLIVVVSCVLSREPIMEAYSFHQQGKK